MVVKVKHKMTSYSHFNCNKRVTEVSARRSFNGKILQRYWKIGGGISFYYGDESYGVCCNVPNGYIYSGPVIPSFLINILKIEPNDPIFKAGIIHEYLRLKCKLNVNGFRCLVNQQAADSIFLEAMKVANVPLWKRLLVYSFARITPSKPDIISTTYKNLF